MLEWLWQHGFIRVHLNDNKIDFNFVNFILIYDKFDDEIFNDFIIAAYDFLEYCKFYHTSD